MESNDGYTGVASKSSNEDGTLTPASSHDQPELEAQHTRGSAWLNFVTRVISWIYGDGVTTSEQPPPNNLVDARMIHPKIGDYPQGFPSLAGFQSSNNAFGIIRMFQYLCTRTLLQQQVELNNLEQELLKQDKLDSTSESKERRNRVRSTTYGEESTEPNILGELQPKLKAYYDLIVLANQVFELQETPTKDYKSVLDWILKEKPLYKGSYDFIWNRDDLVSIAGGSKQGRHSPKQDFFEKLLESWTKFRVLKSFLRPTTEGSVTHYENSRFGMARKALVISTAAFFIIIPVLLSLLADIGRGLSSATFFVFFVFMFSIMLQTVEDPDHGTFFGLIILYSGCLLWLL
ncbi:hypothetical protein B0O99DRAFT_678273 [Bisporella sp. PMI_857]|nr:hypothetical protein B0O99DRAFT_678273 [Bisporella sp. PMI_857]